MFGLLFTCSLINKIIIQKLQFESPDPLTHRVSNSRNSAVYQQDGVYVSSPNFDCTQVHHTPHIHLTIITYIPTYIQHNTNSCMQGEQDQSMHLCLLPPASQDSQCLWEGQLSCPLTSAAIGSAASPPYQEEWCGLASRAVCASVQL